MSEMSKGFPQGHACRVIDGRGTLSGRTGTILKSLEFASMVMIDHDGPVLWLANAEIELGRWELNPGQSERVFVAKRFDEA